MAGDYPQGYNPFEANHSLIMQPVLAPSSSRDHHHHRPPPILHDDDPTTTASGDGGDDDVHLTIASFNILAQDYSTPGSMKHVTPRLLQWDYRVTRIQAVVEVLDADVLCLQEVDRLDGLEGTLRSRGYEWYQTSRPQKLDSCVMAYKKDK